MKIKLISGANMDIDLTSSQKISWTQGICPWNQAENSTNHRCAVKDTSICDYFFGIEYPDKVICIYPVKRSLK